VTFTNAAGTQKEGIDAYSISAKIPMGAFTWKVGYLGVEFRQVRWRRLQARRRRAYDLSKRTSLYSNIGQPVGDRPTGYAGRLPVDIGVTHRF